MLSPEPSPRARRAVLALVLLFAAGLRLAHWLAVRDEPFFAQLAMDSQEYDRWAREIAAGNWLGTEVFFQAPLYPYLLAVVYAVLGHRLDAVYLLQIGFAVAGIYALYRAGREMGGEGVGLAAAGLAALYGPFLFYDVQLLKESLAVTTVSFLLWALAAARNRGALPVWFAAGVLLGVLALLRENALLVVPLLLPLAFWGSAGASRRSRLAAAGLLLLGTVLPLVPVAARNAWVGGSPLPTTYQGGVNFYIGNNEHADGTYRPLVPGKQVPALERREPVRLAEQELGRPLSSAEVSRFWTGKALAWARSHPGDFLELQLTKLRLFWSWYEQPDAVDYYFVETLSPALRLPLLEFGGATLLAALGLWFLRGRWRDFAPALLFAAAWMAATVIFFLFSRYRLPAVPALLLVAALPLAELWAARGRERRLALGMGILAAWLLPHLAGFAPRLDLVYYNLGRLAEEAGRPDEAAAHYQAVLAANPDDLLSLLNLGSYAARRGNLEAALALFTRAAAIEPRSDDAAANLGSAYLGLGQLEPARRHLDRALELNPKSLPALQSRALVALREGNLEEAKSFNRRLLEVDPRNEAALRLRRRLGEEDRT